MKAKHAKGRMGLRRQDLRRGHKKAVNRTAEGAIGAMGLVSGLFTLREVRLHEMACIVMDERDSLAQMLDGALIAHEVVGAFWALRTRGDGTTQ